MNRRSNLPNVAGGMSQYKADYNAAKQNRFRRTRTGISVMGSGADYHYRTEADYLRMLEYARDMDRNDAVIGTMVDRAVSNTIQSGLTVDPETGDESLDQELSERFNEWATDPQECDAAGMMTFADLQEHGLRATFIDGDIFANPMDSGHLQFIEAHRCRTPSNTRQNVVHGIVLDEETRRREEYWFTREDIEPWKALSKVGDIEKYPAYDEDGEPAIFHLHHPKRVTQTRGVTALAPVFDVASQFEDLQFAKLVQAQIVSCIAFIRERQQTYEGGSRDQYGPREQETIDGAKRLLEEIAPGIEIEGEPGEKITGFSPNTPNAEYFQHVRMILTLLGINLGLPLVLLTMDGSETNFSGWRGAVDQARMGFQRNQRWLRDRLCRPTYRWKLRQWISEDPDLARRAANLIASGAIFRHKWNFPGWRYIEPMKDAQADAFRIEKRLSSPRRVLSERGIEYGQEIRDTVADNKLAILEAIAARDEIVGVYPEVEIDWHELLHLANPGELKFTKEMDEAEADGREVASA